MQFHHPVSTTQFPSTSRKTSSSTRKNTTRSWQTKRKNMVTPGCADSGKFSRAVSILKSMWLSSSPKMSRSRPINWKLRSAGERKCACCYREVECRKRSTVSRRGTSNRRERPRLPRRTTSQWLILDQCTVIRSGAEEGASTLWSTLRKGACLGVIWSTPCSSSRLSS